MTDVQMQDPRVSPYREMRSTQVQDAAAPFWARQKGVLLIIGLWVLAHAAVAVFLESAINVDDAIESYLAQSFDLNYVQRNPPVFDWLLYALQQVAGTGPLSFAIMRYGLLFLCAWLVYRIARRVIVEPRLQAMAVYSLSAIWVLGYHSHRILTHSNIMIVGIAGTFLTLLALVRRPSLALYAGLGFWLAWGLIGKFGFAAFLATLMAACLLEPLFRRVILDRRLIVTCIVAALPLLTYSIGLRADRQDVMGAAVETMGQTGTDWQIVITSWVEALFGYVMPLVALLALIFLPFNRGGGERPQGSEEQAAIRRVLRNIMLLGVLASFIMVVGMGVSTFRDRYFHVFLLFLPVYLFAELEFLGGWRPRVALYLGVLVALAIGILGGRILVTLWPSPALCGRCLAAEPLYKIAPVIFETLGPSPTLVADDRTSGGRLRAAVPGARVLVLGEPEYRPPSRPSTGCARVTGIATGLPIRLPPPRRETIEIAIKWPAPFLHPPRWSDWQIIPLPADSSMCR
ncbi:glycosyltransferase family 39 protein [Xanthobacter sp. TB0139]|uniref:glycosyltransferase family 39 protein n=1 Tax=Xanthobacter sp. TB0139 TaxID=3459178 RepID=UPI004039238A